MEGNRDPRIRQADAAAIAQAGAMLRAGHLVVVPTETVYGLAARADDDRAVAAIYRAKGRPSFNPLIVHLRDVDQARGLATFDDRSDALAREFWPGPLTLVLPVRADAGLAAAVMAGLPTVALRIPAHPVMRAVLAAAALPLAAPSANRSGAVSPTTAAHVAGSLTNGVDLILDDGPSARGVESTIVAMRQGGWQVLRPGPIDAVDIASVIGPSQDRPASNTIEAPGQMASHYAPGKPVRLNAFAADDDEFHVGFGPVAGHVTLSASGDPVEAAARLYAVLHEAARSSQPRIAVAPIPEHGIGAAINDRLCRASA